MLNEQDLKMLLSYEPDSPVLSVYIHFDPMDRSGGSLPLRSLMRGLPDASAEDQRIAERYLEQENRGSGRSAAIFSCASQGFFHAFAFSLPLRDRARWMPKPYVKPLADLIDSYGGYGVALVDKQTVRLFHFHLGELVESDEVEGEAVRRIKQGSATSRHGTRARIAITGGDEKTTEQRNIRLAADAAARFFAARAVRRVMLAGTEETTSKFQAALPKMWQSLIVGTFPAGQTTGQREILARAMEVATQAEKTREADMVNRAVTAAAKGQGGVIGLEDTLRALHDGRVHTLLLSEGFRAGGYRCTGCGFLNIVAAEHCPYCQETFTPIEDAVEKAVEEVMRGNGEVEVVRDNPALEQAGRMAAILRY